MKSSHYEWSRVSDKISAICTLLRDDDSLHVDELVAHPSLMKSLESGQLEKLFNEPVVRELFGRSSISAS